MDLYADNILDHYRHPRNAEPLSSPTVRHEEKNLSCGDAVTLDLQMTNGKITGIGWVGTGCAISQAGMSMLSEELIGKSEEEIDALGKKDIDEMLGVPIGPRRFKCALLGLHTLKNALRKGRGEAPQGWAETVGMD